MMAPPALRNREMRPHRGTATHAMARQQISHRRALAACLHLATRNQAPVALMNGPRVGHGGSSVTKCSRSIMEHDGETV
jgi:hypothetical protein